MSGNLERTPGVIRTISGRVIDLSTFNADDIDMFDIAWGLGNIRRYNGHTVEDYTVAHHSIIMSYYVPKEFALEALLHDAAEAYVGDIVWPVKALFPEMERFENELAHVIMKHFDVPGALSCHPIGLQNGKLVYEKSKQVKLADRTIFEHECFEMGRPGIYHEDMEAAWVDAAVTHQEYWYAPQYAFIQRFRELMGEIEDPHELREDGTIDYLDGLWYKKKPEAVVENNKRIYEQLEAQQLLLDDMIMEGSTKKDDEQAERDWNDYVNGDGIEVDAVKEMEEVDERLGNAQSQVDALLDSMRNTGAANDG